MSSKLRNTSSKKKRKKTPNIHKRYGEKRDRDLKKIGENFE